MTVLSISYKPALGLKNVPQWLAELRETFPFTVGTVKGTTEDADKEMHKTR